MQIRNISGVHPPEVETLLDAEISIDAAQLRRPEVLDLTDPARAEEAVLELARFNAISGEAFSQAKSSARSTLANHLLRAVARNAEFYQREITAGFEDTAEEYTKNVSKLPEEFSTETILGFSPAEFKAYGAARNAAAQLQGIRAELANFPELAGGHRLDTGSINANHLIVRGNDLDSWKAVQYAPVSGDAAFQAIAPDLRIALNHGAEFEISTVEEAVERCRMYQAS
jgi:hypothetical protein